MGSSWKLAGLTWKELGRRVYARVIKDEVFGRAAQLSYYFLLALFPLLLFLTSLLGYFAEAGTALRDELLAYLSRVMPASASALVYETLEEISKSTGSGKLSFGIIASLWAASTGVAAMTNSLNAAYGIEETRPWWKARLISILLTVMIAVLIISALVLLFGGGKIAAFIAGTFEFGDVFTFVWSVLQWPVLLAFVLLAFGLIYYLAPALEEQKWHWITPGAVIGVVLWLAVSFAFRIYLHFFNSYSATYGSLGAVIVMLLWFYLTGAAILIGGEVNSEIENASETSRDPEANQSVESAPAEKAKLPAPELTS